MKNLFFALSLFLVHWSAYSWNREYDNRTPEEKADTRTIQEIRRDYAAEVSKQKKIFAECRFVLSTRIAPKYNSGIVPTLKKFPVSDQSQVLAFPFSSKTVGFSMYFPPAKAFLPISFLADILYSPVTAVKKIIERKEIKAKIKVSEEKFIKDTIEFKKEWEKIEPNKFKRHQLINELYVYQFVSDIHGWLVNKEGMGEVANKGNYQFIYPFIYKAIGQKQKIEAGEWKIYNAKERRNIDINVYFQISDFQQILKEKPKLCSSPGLDALDVIGNGYGKIIGPKISK